VSGGVEEGSSKRGEEIAGIVSWLGKEGRDERL
jgi:hypothetical protein